MGYFLKLSNYSEIILIIYLRIVKIFGVLKLKPAVFLHIQKTAGTSIVSITKQLYGNKNFISHGDFCLDSSGVRLSDVEIFQPENYRRRLGNKLFISGHFGYDFAKEFMEDRYSFTFLRDPVERLLSYYYFCKTRIPNEFRMYELAQRLTLDEFLELGLTNPESRSHLWNHQVSQLATGWGSASNVVLTDEELLELAIQHLDEFSYVGFTETFEEDKATILKDIGITIPVGNHKFNTNLGRPLFDGLPTSSKKLLLELTELDRVLYETAWSRKNKCK
jgi:Sulfotransferase family